MMSAIKFCIALSLLSACALADAQTSTQNNDQASIECVDQGAETQTEDNAEEPLAAGVETCADDDELVRSAKGQLYFEQIEAVLNREQFGKEVSRTGWRQKDRKDKQARHEKFPEWIISIIEYLERNEARAVKVSQGLEIVLWLLLGGLVLLLIVKYRQQIGSLITRLSSSQTKRELPSTLFGLDVEKSSLPTDVVNVSREHWRNGETRQSVALLLRASLINLLHDHNCHFTDSNTESECVAQIDRKAASNVSAFMRSLVSVWQQLAYAHKPPSNAVFEELCQRWQEVF